MPRYDFSRFLNIRNAHSPSFSPDGARIAFLCDITGVPQVWSVPAAGGWPDQLTFYPERVSALEYAPAGDRLVFGMDAGGNERQGLYSLTPGGEEVAPLATNPAVIHGWGSWSPDGAQIAYASNARDPRFFDIYVRPLDGEPRLVYRHDGTNNVRDWRPDGRALLLERRNGSLDNDLLLLDLDSGEAHLLTAHEGEALHAGARFAGDAIVLTTNRDREFMAPARLDPATGQLYLLAEHPWDAEEIVADAGGQFVAYTVNEDGYSRLYLAGDRAPVAGLPDGVIAGLRLAPDGATLAFALYGPTRNANIWTLDIATRQARQVTNASRAGIADEALSTPRPVHYPSFDGLEIPAFLYLPRGVAGPVPVVVHVHGGPEGQARPILNPTIQYLAHRGFGVLATNVRGSTGYGKTFTHLDDVRKRMDSVADLEAAVRWLKASGTARPDAIAVMGGSYGGFMTLSAVTTYPDLWAAAVCTVGIANFVTFLEQTGPWRRKLRESEYGNLEDDREFLEAISPINHVDRITAPLLVIHGANDPRVPVGEAEQIVESLRARGREVGYLRYEDEGHGLVKLPNRMHAAEATAAFLDRFLAAD